MKKGCFAALLIALTALALACGKSEDKKASAIPAPSGTAATGPSDETIPGGPGELPAEIAQGELPKDFPSDLPIYPGAKPTTAMMVGGSGLVVLNSPASIADVLAHYREELPKQGWTVDEVSESPGRVAAHKGKRTATISISQGEGGQTEIGLALETS